MKRSLGLGALAIVAAWLFANCGARTDIEGRSTDAGVDAGPQCLPGTMKLSPAQPAVLFVLDRSTSMEVGLGESDLTRWQALTNALAAALPAADGEIAIGALLFPSEAKKVNCVVAAGASLEPKIGNAAALVELMQSSSPGGATPTADAIDAGAKVLLAIRTASTARALVLATDGAPNCNAALDSDTCRCSSGVNHCQSRMCLDDVRTAQRIAGYYAQGLPTYVLGIGGEDDKQFEDVLNALAYAGGRPLNTGAQLYYAASSESELDSALVAIRDQVRSCTYLTPSIPGATGSVSVTLDGRGVEYDPEGIEGWMWSDKANGQLVLVGSACDQAVSSAASEVVAMIRCD